MDQLIAFVSHNTLLVVAIVIVAAMLVNSLFAEKLRGFKSVTPTESTLMINHDNAVVLDVRENNEYKDGHIINSLHIPLSALPNRLNQLEKYKGQKIIVACRSGNRSSHACSTLKKNGFEEIYNLSGGIMAWENAGLPLVKK